MEKKFRRLIIWTLPIYLIGIIVLFIFLGGDLIIADNLFMSVILLVILYIAFIGLVISRYIFLEAYHKKKK
jgi:hypothetical protein